MIRLSPQNDRVTINMPLVDVWTYGKNKAKQVGEVRVKRIMTPEPYVFPKRHFAEGGFAKIYVGLDPKNDYPVAIKELMVKPSTKRMLDQDGAASRWSSVVRELTGARASERSYGPLRAVQNTKRSKVYIIQNLLSGTVKDAIEELTQRCPRRSVVLICAHAIMSDFMKLQNKKVLHFDLHSKNILYDKNRHAVEIIDFGGSEIGDRALPTSSSSKSNFRQQLQTFECTARSDLFTLGATFAEYATGRELFDGPNHAKACLFSTKDLEDMRYAPLSAEKRAHLEAYRTDLFAVCSDFGALCLDMMNMQERSDLSVPDVLRRVRGLFDTVDDGDWMLFDAAWARLPEYSPAIREHIQLVRESVRDIRNGALKRVA